MKERPIEQLDIILFEKDWANYPTAIRDYRTRNESALKLTALLKKMGVRNNDFILALINPSLQGVDPRDPNLSADTRKAISVECRINPWYYFREVASVPGQGSGNEYPFVRLNRSNVYIWWCYFNHLTTIVVQLRQTGKSFAADQLEAYMLMAYGQNMNISLVTKDESLRVETVDRVKAIMDTYPPYLDYRKNSDRASTELIEVSALGNRYKPYVAQSSEAGAHKLGRGASTANIHFDEPPFQKLLHVHYSVIMGSTGAKIDEAKDAKTPWGVLMTTTAWKKNTPEGKFFDEIVQGAAVWNEAYFDCEDIDDLYYTLYKASRDGATGYLQKGNTGMVSVFASFNHRQLGYSDQWLRETLSRNRNPDPEDINRDYFNISTSGSESHPLPQATLDTIIESKRQVAYLEIDPKYRYSIRWYLPKDEVDAVVNSRQVIAGVDMSEGVGKDFITLLFMDTATGKVLGCSVVKESNTTIYAAWFHQLVVRFPSVVFIIENKSMGVALHDALLVSLPAVGIDPYKRLYNRAVDDAFESSTSRQLFEQIKQPLMRRDKSYFYGSYKKLFGYNTAASGRHSRDRLYESSLSRGAPMVASGVHDETLIEQLMALSRKDGRIDHAEGQHDDLVIAWLLCLYFLFNARNVNYYGMDARSFLSQTQQLQDSPEQQQADIHEEQQRQLRSKLDYLLGQYEQESDPNLLMQLDDQIQYLESQLKETDQSAITVAEWISKAEEIRKRKRQRRTLETTRVSGYGFGDERDRWQEGDISHGFDTGYRRW